MSFQHFVLCDDGKWRNRRGASISSDDPGTPQFIPILLGTTERAPGPLQTKLHAINSNATLRIIRRYHGAFPSSFASTAGQDDVGQNATWISFSSPSVAQINSGSFDATLDAFFASIPATHRCLVTYLHEANNKNDEKLGGSSRAEFATATARIWASKEANAQVSANISVGPILTAEPYRDGSFVDYYPAGSSGFDFVGADPYRFWRDINDPNYLPDPKANGPGQSRTMAYLIGDPAADGSAGAPAFAAARGKKIALGEYGAHPFPSNANNRPAWLSQTDEYLKTVGCMAAIYFHSPAGESGPWWLDQYHHYTVNETDPARNTGADDPDSLETFAAILASNQGGI